MLAECGIAYSVLADVEIKSMSQADIQMHNGSFGSHDSRSGNASSRSAGSSTRSCSADFVRFTGESGVVASEELELGQRLWLRCEKVEAIGEDVFDAPDELRECAGEIR